MQKSAAKRALYAQLLFTTFAFLAMVVLSYVFVNRIVYFRDITQGFGILCDTGMDSHAGQPLDFNEVLDKLRIYLPLGGNTNA